MWRTRGLSSGARFPGGRARGERWLRRRPSGAEPGGWLWTPGQVRVGPGFPRGRCALSSAAQGWRGSGVPGTSRLGLLAFQSPRAWSPRLQPSDGVGGALGTPRRHPSECGFKVEKKRAPGRKRPSPHFLRFPLWPAKEAALSPLATRFGEEAGGQSLWTLGALECLPSVPTPCLMVFF